MEELVKYIGPNSEMGYHFGTLYYAKVKIHKNLIIIQARKMPRKGYTSISRMLEEWEFNPEEWVLPGAAEPEYQL